jgi:hypothetical protein
LRAAVELLVNDDAQEWRWVGEDGVEKALTEQELIAELSSESLPHYTLVWKKRWLEWLPAMQVAELGWALPPGKAERGVKPRERPGAQQPPPPPLYLYPVLKRRAAIAEPIRAAPRPSSGAPMEDVEMEAIAASSPASVPDAQLGSVRPPNSDDDVTLVHDADFTSDPARSFEELEPVRARFAGRAYSEDDDGDTHVLPSRPPGRPSGPPPLGPVYVGPHSVPASEAPGPTYDENEIPHIPRPPGSPTDLSAYTRMAPTSDIELLAPPPPRWNVRAYGAALGAAVVGIGAALLVLRSCNAERVAAANAASSASASASSAREAKGPSAVVPAPRDERPRGPPCTVVTPALRVADWAEPLVTPVIAPIPGSGRLAVGFAQSETYAVGVTIDPRSLDRDQVFREFRREKLVSVVPASQSGKLRFEIARAGHPLSNARTIDAPTPFVIGATPFSIARLGKTAEPEPIWPVADAEQSTLARVVPVPGTGFAVALRRGGKDGPVAVGLLDATGGKRSELIDVKSEGTVGTPALATDDASLLVTFAARNGSAPWEIAAGLSRVDEGPRKSVRLRLRDGGPGGDRMSPSAGALGGGRWLVQWTEGSAGNRMARAEVVGADLAPLTEAVNLSPDGANAGQGVVWTSGDAATILFFVRNAKNNNELWGVSLECPR